MSDTVSVGEYARAAHTLSIRVVVIERAEKKKVNGALVFVVGW